MAIEHWRIVSQLDRSYAERRGDEIPRSFDDSMVALRPLNWRDRVVRLTPMLPRAHTRLLPDYGADTFQLMISDSVVRQLAAKNANWN